MSLIREYMTVDTPMCTPLTSIENIKKLMEENESDEVLVVDSMLERHLVGVINGNDISAKSFDQSVLPSSLNAEQCMKPVAITARETITLEECQRILDENHLEHLAIIDDEGHLCGVYDRVNHLKAASKAEPTTTPTETVDDQDDLEAEKMESEGGHDSHTVH